MDYKVSVIVPVFNKAAYISTCMDSILGQTLEGVEVVCINDGSTDDSLSILHSYSADNKDVVVIDQRNMGVAYSRNVGIKESHGEFLAFMDPDDSYLLATVGRMYRDGNGAVKDEAKALDMIDRAFDSGAEWVRNDLIDLLLGRGSDADCKKAFVLAREKQNDPWTEFRLARMYRDGKGTRANIDKAIRLMRDARDHGVAMAIPEMDELLYRRRSPEDLRELYADLKPRAEEGDPWANAKIARLYRDGAGTERNIDKAIEAMKIAAEGGVPWAEKELADMLSKKK